MRQQGEAVTDKVAEAVKDRLFGGAPKPAAQSGSGPVDVGQAEVRPTEG